MLVEFDSHVLQLRYVRAAMASIATYKPDGMTVAAMDGVLTNAGTVRQAYVDAKQTFDPALQQGRAQFKSGTEREVINAIPTEPAQQAPGQATINAITTPGAGVIHIEFDAPHATSFDVFMKKQADAAFTQVADDTVARTHDATGLVAGTTYNFKVVGRNSLGQGPESGVVSKVAT